MRFSVLTSPVAVSALLAAAFPAAAHHGWFWDTTAKISVSGRVEKVLFGNPHSVLKLDVDGTTWTVEIGTARVTRRAAIDASSFPRGTRIVATGWHAADPEVARLQALRIMAGDRTYVLERGDE